MGDGQIGPQRIDGHLQADAQGLADGVEQAHAPAGARLQVDDAGIERMPARADGADHAHCPDRGRIAGGPGKQGGGLPVDAVGFQQVGRGHALGQDAEGQHQRAARHGDHAHSRMQDEDKEEINGHPRHVQKGKDRIAAQKGTQGLHVADLSSVRLFLQGRGHAQLRIQHGEAQYAFKFHTGPDEQAGAYPLQRGQRREATTAARVMTTSVETL